MAAACDMLTGHQLNMFLPTGLPGQPGPEAKRQICFDFTKGTCMRGDSCKYSHDFAHIVQVNSEERGICFDFLRGQCARGLLCRFSHDLSSIVAQQQMQHTQGVSAATKRGAPICYDFVKGSCTRGAECRYSHDITSVISSSRARTAGPTEPCFDFLRGKCNRGQNCRYSHALPAPQAPGWPAGAPMPPALLAANGLPLCLPRLAPQMPGLPAATGMSVCNAVVPQDTDAIRAFSNGALSSESNVYGAGNCSTTSRFPLQQLGTGGGPHNGQPPHIFGTSQQSFELMAHMAAIQAANAVAAHNAQQFAGAQNSASHAVHSQPTTRQNSQDDLADELRKMQLAQQFHQRNGAKKDFGSDLAPGSLNHDDEIRAVWDAHRLGLPQLVTTRRSLPPSGACTPGACTPRTPALPPHHPFSNPARQGSHSTLPSSLGPNAATLATVDSDLSSLESSRATTDSGWEAQSGACSYVPSANAMPPPPPPRASLLAAPVQQPVTAPAGFCHPVSMGQATTTAGALSQPGSARAAAAAAATHNSLFSAAFDAAPAGAPSFAQQAPAPSQAVMMQVQSWLDQPERPSSAADPQLLSRLQTIWQPQ